MKKWLSVLLTGSMALLFLSGCSRSSESRDVVGTETTLAESPAAETEPLKEAQDPVRILFVCTGNTCRSPMAEVLAKKIFAGKGIAAEISSAGTAADEGDPASRNGVLAMDSRGIDLTGHKARQVTEEMVAQSDLILIMAQKNKDYVLDMPGTDPEKVFLLHEYTMDNLGNVSDPYGRRLDVYQATADEIAAALERAADRVGGTELETIQGERTVLPYKLLFVDDKNTDLSVMASAMAQIWYDGLDIPADMSSAGVEANAGEAVSEQTAAAMAERGLDVSAQQSQQITADMVNQCDFVITMTTAQKDQVMALPDVAHTSIYTLADLVEEIEGDIELPEGAESNSYAALAEKIAAALEQLPDIL